MLTRGLCGVAAGTGRRYVGAVSRSWHRAGVLGALMAASWLRLGALGRESLWLDELFSVRVATRESWGAMLDDLAVDVHPPAWFAGMRLWSTLAGHSDVVWRLPSALSGVATVGVCALLAGRLGGPGAAVAAAWLMATAPAAVLLDREVRSNALMALLAVLLAWLLDVAERRLLVVLVAAALVNVHYFGAFAGLGLGAWALANGDRRSAAGVAIGGLALLPWVGTAAGQLTAAASHPWYVAPSPDALGWIWSGLSDDRPGLAVLLVIGAAYALQAAPRVGLLLVTGLFGVVLLPQVLSYELTPVLRVRSALPLLPLLLVVVSVGYTRLGSAGAAMIGLLATAQGVVSWRATRAEARMEQWREAAALVQADGALVIANHPQLWRYYLPEHIWLRDAADPGVDGAPGAWVLLAHDLDEPPALAALTAGAEVRQESRLVGVWARELGPIARPIQMRAAPDTPGLVDGPRVELWSNGGVVSGELRVRGRCAVEVEGSEDPAGSDHARLRVRLSNPDGVVLDAEVELGPSTAAVRTPALAFPLFGEPGQAAVTLAVDFVNDAVVDGRDRNVHIAALRLRCTD